MDNGCPQFNYFIVIFTMREPVDGTTKPIFL